MKANMIKRVSTAVILLGSVAGASVAQAVLFNGAIGSAASSADVYKLNCGPGTVGARALIVDDLNVSDGVKRSVMVVRLEQKKILAATATAPELSMNTAVIAGGVDNYHVIVTKDSGSQVEAYQVDIACYDVNGADMGVSAILGQNQ